MFQPKLTLLDKNPCYEVSTGKYLKRNVAYYCPSCMETSIFVPKDKSISSGLWGDLQRAESLRVARQNVPVVESHDDIARLTIPQLEAWIESAKLKYKCHLNKSSLVTLAGILLDRLHGWKDSDIQARLRAFQAHGFSKKALAVGTTRLAISQKSRSLSRTRILLI